MRDQSGFGERDLAARRRAFVEQQLKSTDPAVFTEAAAALSVDIRPGREWAIAQGIALLPEIATGRTMDTDVDDDIVRALAKCGDKRAIPAIAEALRSVTRAPSAFRAAYVDTNSPELLEALRTKLERTDHNGVSQPDADLAWTLIQKNIKDLGPLVAKHIEEDGQSHGVQVSSLLVELRDPATLPAIDAYLAKHADARRMKEVRVRVAAKNREEEVAGMIALAEGEKDAKERQDLWETIGNRYKSPKAVGPLSDYMLRNRITWGGVSALGKIGGREAIETLVALLERDHSKVQAGKTGDPGREWRERIVGALEEATGEKRGEDPKAWRERR